MVFVRWMKMFILSSIVSHQTMWGVQIWRHLNHSVLVTLKQSLQKLMIISFLRVISGFVSTNSTVQRTHTEGPVWGSKWISICCIGVKKASIFIVLCMHNIWNIFSGVSLLEIRIVNILILNEHILFLVSLCYSRKIAV